MVSRPSASNVRDRVTPPGASTPTGSPPASYEVCQVRSAAAGYAVVDGSIVFSTSPRLLNVATVTFPRPSVSRVRFPAASYPTPVVIDVDAVTGSTSVRSWSSASKVRVVVQPFPSVDDVALSAAS